MATNLELYEALKKTLDEEAARMIAEVVPAAGDVATKADIAGLDRRIDGLDRRIDGVERKIDELEAALTRRTLAFFMPLWIAVLATMVALLLK